MTVRDFPREYFNIAGMQVTVEGDTVAAREVISEARSLMYRLKLMTPEGLEQNWLNMQLANGGTVAVNINHGVKTVHIFVPPRPEVPKEAEILLPTVSNRPVPVFCLETEDNFVGFWVCSSLTWNSPTWFQKADLEKVTAVPQYKNSQEIQRTPLIEKVSPAERSLTLYPLEKIGEPIDAKDSTYTHTYTKRWGKNQEWDSPEHALFGVEGGNWQLYNPGTAEYCLMRDENTGIIYTVYHFSSCMRIPAIAFVEDLYTGSMFTSIRVGSEESNPVFPVGDMQYWTWTDIVKTTEWLQVGDTVIVNTASGLTRTWYTEGNLSIDGDCNSFSTLDYVTDDNSQFIWWDLVVATEDNLTYIALYDLASEEYPPWHQERSPWAHEPYYAVADDPWHPADPPGPDNYVRHKYIMQAAGEWGSITYEFAEEFLWLEGSEEDSDAVNVMYAGIYDFHGKPVYWWSWKDCRDNSAQYGLLYNGEVTLSDKFYFGNCDEDELHDIYNSREFGGQGNFYAVIAGIEEVDTVVVKE